MPEGPYSTSGIPLSVCMHQRMWLHCANIVLDLVSLKHSMFEV